ncbi:hypothetical protein G6F32_016230 [Rhizopus arrhizus]|nr:hypothetical protein G6F32_016230 [Rhizopus arrhizus]
MGGLRIGLAQALAAAGHTVDGPPADQCQHAHDGDRDHHFNQGEAVHRALHGVAVQGSCIRASDCRGDCSATTLSSSCGCPSAPVPRCCSTRNRLRPCRQRWRASCGTCPARRSSCQRSCAHIRASRRSRRRD